MPRSYQIYRDPPLAVLRIGCRQSLGGGRRRGQCGKPPEYTVSWAELVIVPYGGGVHQVTRRIYLCKEHAEKVSARHGIPMPGAVRIAGSTIRKGIREVVNEG